MEYIIKLILTINQIESNLIDNGYHQQKENTEHYESKLVDQNSKNRTMLI